MSKKNKRIVALIVIIAVMIFYVVMIIIILIERSSPDYVPRGGSNRGGSGIMVILTSPIWIPMLIIYRFYMNNNPKFRRFTDINDEIAYSRYEVAVKNHFVYTVLLDLPKSKFVLMIDVGTKIISPAVYTKRKDKISIINRDAEYTLFEHMEFLDNDIENDYTFIRSCKIKDKKSGEQVLFAAVPNRETDILAYSDSVHTPDKTVTFGKFRIFCFAETENNPCTDLMIDSEKVPLVKSKRKGMYFIGLNEVTKDK